MSQPAQKSFPTALNPRLSARRAAFIEAGRQAFEEKGFAETTLDDVIAGSGGSRQTLYSLFGGKQGLFEAIVSDSCETIFRGLEPEMLAAGSLRDGLEKIGTRYLALVTSPACLSLHRLIVAEAARFPELARLYWSHGPGTSRAFLVTLFETQALHGRLKVSAPRIAADHFLEMLSGTVRMQCLIGLRAPPTKTEVRKLVSTAVEHFLDGCFAQPVAKAS